MVTAAILGLGARGAEGYGRFSLIRPDLLKITAICDINKERIDKYGKLFNVPEQNSYYTAEDMLRQDKLADVMFICTQDRDHFKHVKAALEKGYDILLEKPISPVSTVISPSFLPLKIQFAPISTVVFPSLLPLKILFLPFQP